VAYGGLELVMIVDAASFMLNGLLLALLMKPRFPRALSQGRSMLSDLADGFRYLWRTGPVPPPARLPPFACAPNARPGPDC
jgi:hypothetical protein